MTAGSAVGSLEFGKSFSCPGSRGAEDFAAMQQALLRIVVRRVERACSAAGSERTAKSFETIIEPMCERLVGKSVWLPELAFVLHLCREGRPEPATAQLALALSSALSGDDEWSLDIGDNAEMLFGGSLFVAGGKISARFQQQAADISVRNGGESLELIFSRDRELWVRQGECLADICDPYLLRSNAINLYVNGFKTGDEVTAQVPLLSCARAVTPEKIAKHAEVLATGIATIEEIGADYVCWVAQTIKMVQMLDCWRSVGDPVYTSCSWPSRPGIVSMGLSIAPTLFEHKFRIADSFIHEASHQYVNLLNLAFPLANGADTKLYYSVLARRERPIDRVLLAFHAAGNMALFYADAIKLGRSECAHNFKWAVECANSLRDPIEQTAGLTDVGLGVFRPLASALDRIELGDFARA